MSTRPTRPTPPFSVKKISCHGISLFVFDASEHLPDAKPFLAVVLRPTAEAIGLNSEWFNDALRQSRNEDVTRSVRGFSFKPSAFKEQASEKVSSSHRGSRSRSYQCLPLSKMEVLLNGIDIDRLKNPEAAVRILVLQKTINGVIEKYFHEGIAVNTNAEASGEDFLRLKADIISKAEIERIRLRVKTRFESKQEIEVSIPLKLSGDETAGQLLALEREESDKPARKRDALRLAQLRAAVNKALGSVV